MIYKRRILSVEAVDAVQSLCTRYTKITVATPTAPAPPAFSGEVKGITPNVTYPMIVASPAVDVPTVLEVSPEKGTTASWTCLRFHAHVQPFCFGQRLSERNCFCCPLHCTRQRRGLL